ncbi:MAG: aromatic amino acid DMT transporter YddG [Planctomycetes bacterium]|nr:aromatic amino acid DMT transporter YddG [Planctomycetota bacterium]
MEQDNGRTNRYTAGGLAAIVLWSTTFAVARSLSEQAGPLTAGACVYLLGGLLYGFWLARSPVSLRRLRLLSPRYVWGCGSLFVLYTVLIYLAIGLAADHQQVLEIGLINYLWPVATILLSLVLLDQRASALLVPGTILALAGEFLVITQGAPVSWRSFAGHLQAHPTPYALALAAAVSWALYSTLTRRWSQPGADGAVALFLPATGLALLLLRFIAQESSAWTLRAGGEAVVMATLTVLAYTFWDGAMRKGNLLLVTACSYFTPLLSTLVTCAYLRVAPTGRLWLGCLMLVAGSFLTWRSVARRSSPRPNQLGTCERGAQ